MRNHCVVYLSFLLLLVVSTAQANVRLTEDPSASERPVVAVCGSSEVVVVWQDNRDGNYEIYWRRFTELGEPLTGEVRVTNTADKSVRPDVSCDALGNSYMVWQEGEDPNGVGTVYFTVLDLSGGRVLANDVLMHNFSGDARIYTRGNGMSGVVWHRFMVSDQSVYFRRLSATGVNLCQQTFSITMPAFNKTPSVAMLTNGSGYIFWRDRNTMFAEALYEGQVNSSCQKGQGLLYSNDNALHPDVDVKDGTNVAWTNFEMSGRIYNDRDNQNVCPITDAGGSATLPRVATDGANGFVTWKDSRDGNNEIYMCRFYGCNNETGDVRLTNNGANSTRPDMAAFQDGGGKWVSVWQDSRDGNWEVYMTGLEIRGFGALTGQVTELGGAPVLSGATVTVMQGGQVFETTTTGVDGRYLTPLLPIGSYDVRFEMPSYRTHTDAGVAVAEGLPTVLDAELTYDWVFEIAIDPFGANDDPADSLNVVATITNRSGRDATNIVVTLWADGIQLGADETIPSLTIDEAHPVARGTTVPNNWSDRPVTCLIESVDGQPAGPSSSVNVSVYYPMRHDNQPFDLDRDAYTFVNERPPLSAWQDVFTGFCVPAETQLLGFLFTIRGVCFGMSATCAAYFEDPSTKPVAQETAHMQASDSQVMNEIYHYHVRLTSRIAQRFSVGWNDPASEETKLKDHLSNNRVPIIFLQAPNETAAHAVAGYRLTENVSEQTANVRVYENVFDPPTAIEDRAQSAAFTLDGDGAFSYKNHYTKLDVTHNPAAGFQKDLCESIKETLSHLFSFQFDWDKILVFHKCPVYALITDDSGRRIGFIDPATFVNEIPGAVAEFHEAAPNDSAAFYYVPNGVEYTVEYFGTAVGSLQTQVVIPTGPGTAIARGQNNVLVQANTVASLTVSAMSGFVLDVDIDGDGNVDQQIPPDYDNMSPSAPALVYPTQAEQITNLQPTFAWSPSFDLDGDSLEYHLTLSGDSLFSNPIADTTVTDTTWACSITLGFQDYYWAVVARDARGLETASLTTEKFSVVNVTGITDRSPIVPSLRVFPSPARSSVTFYAHLAEAAPVEIAIYDVAGRLVRSFDLGRREAGDVRFVWNGLSAHGLAVPTGVYFGRLTTGSKTHLKKFVMIR